MGRHRRRFHLNRDKQKFLGVCAGIADFLDVAAFIVRIIFVVALLMGVWVLVPAYFVCYFLMDNNSGEFKDKVTSSKAFKHFRNVDYKKRLYRNTEERKILGVCAGIADYFEIDVRIVRLVTFISLFVAGPIPWMAYIAAYFLLDEKALKLTHQRPGDTFRSSSTNTEAKQGQFKQGSETEQKPQDESFKNRKYSNRREFQSCARKFSNLHQRLSKIEAFVTSKKFKLHQDFKDLT